MTSPKKLFSQKRLIAHAARARHISKKDADFLAVEAVENLISRLGATNRDFENTIDLFSPFDCMRSALRGLNKTNSVNSIRWPVATGNDSKTLALPERTYNLITSVFGLHWLNDLPGMLMQIRSALVADGLFLAALPGERTLQELRASLLKAETAITGNATLRVEPFGEIRQFGNLLQQAGFALPVVDKDIVTVRYQNMYELIADLRAMGVTSALAHPCHFGPRNLFEVAERIYRDGYSDPDGKIRATFEFVYLSGWAPHPSQQKPLKPGSARNRLVDFLGK